MSMRKPIENRELKNTVFVDLFQMCPEAKENALSLYNALNGTDLSDPSVIEQIRLDDTIYKGIRNDVSFAVEDKIIVLMEHQSTVNENMPLRFFMYLARLYEKIISTRLRYKKKLVKIPVPEMFVFYNGTEPLPPRTTLRLSDAFINNPEFNEIELTVTVINISASAEKTDDILEKCGIIKEYSKFVDIVRDFISKKTEQPYKEAIRYCIKNGILKGYLEREGTEVESMLIAEYDYDTDIAVQREESYEEGIADLSEAIKALRSGNSKDDVIKQYGSDVVNVALQFI